MVGHLNRSFLQGRDNSPRIKLFVLGREVAVTYFGQERSYLVSCGWRSGHVFVYAYTKL